MKERAKALFLALIVVLMTQTTGIMLGVGDASEDEAPFFVKLEIFVDPKNLSLAGTAGGSLISDRHILTAAHSLVRMKTNKGFLVAFIRGKSEILALRVEAVEVLIHPLFISKNKNETRADNDVAIITLPVPLINSHGFKTIPYETDPYEYFDNKLVKIYGFGRNSLTEPNQYATRLQVGIMRVVDTCDEDWDGIFYDEEMLCLKGGASPCKNDSGGPVIYNGKLIGIISWGNYTCDPASPSVVMRVGYYADWISKNIA